MAVCIGQGEKIQLEVLADGHPLLVLKLSDESTVTIDLPAGVAGTVPGLAIFLLVLAFNFVGDALRDVLDPRLRGILH